MNAVNTQNALLVAYYFPPEPASGAARPSRFYRYLPRFGYNVAAVCCNDGQIGATARLITADSERAGPAPRPVQIASFLAKVVQKLLRRNDYRLPWLFHALSASRPLFSSEPIVISTFPPLCTHLVALWLKLRFKFKWVADFRDPLVGNPFGKQRPMRRLDEIVERLIFKYADAVIANTEPVRLAWETKYPQHADKITVIENGFDPEERVGPKPIPANSCRVIRHIGDIYGARRPHMLLSAIARLSARGQLQLDSIRVHLVGPIDENSPLWQDADALDLVAKGVLQIDGRLVSRTVAVDAAATCDYLLLLDINESNSVLQVPAKLFDYIRIGRPILVFTVAGSPTENILEKSGVHYTVVYVTDEPDAVDDKVSEFLSSSSAAVSPSQWFRNKFDGVKQTEALARTLNRIHSGTVDAVIPEELREALANRVPTTSQTDAKR